MLVKTSELQGAALDWAVCRALGIPSEEIYVQRWGSQPASLFRRNRDEDGRLDGTYTTGPDLLFSRKWESGGPIIDRERISPEWMLSEWKAHQVYAGTPYKDAPHLAPLGTRFVMFGPTPLIAAMRCFVASKLGDEVDVPEEFQ